MLPRLLLITDAPFSEPACGIDRTLQNIFDFYPLDLLCILAPQSIVASRPPRERYRDRVKTFRDRLVPFHLPFHRVAEWVRWSVLAAMPRSPEDIEPGFSPDVIVVCSSIVETSLVAAAVTREFRGPVVYYGMDDLLGMERSRWNGGNGKELLAFLLERADAWMMISDELGEEYEKRFRCGRKPRLIIHNPVRSTLMRGPHAPSFGPLKIAYAGSVWPMHRDPLLAVAEAVAELRSTGENVELVMYVGKEFWDGYRTHWERLGVRYGGLLPYEELLAALGSADYLLACASFDPECLHLSRTSVQTKLTDYMAAGRPIFVCGPEDSACVRFVEKFRCGVSVTTRDVETLRLRLVELAKSPELATAAAERGRRALIEELSCEVAEARVRRMLLELCDRTVSEAPSTEEVGRA